MQEIKNHFQKISVIVPAYNKEHNLKAYLKTLADELEKLPYAYEVILINDGSRDKTLESAIDYVNSSRKDNFKIISYPLNVGKGFALCYGFTQSTGDPVIFFDADLDIHPRQIHMLIEYLVLSQADIVVGSRRHPDSISNYPAIRRLMSRGYQYLTRLLFGFNVRDTQLGLKIFKRQVLADILPRLTIKRWAFDIEILIAARQHGYKKIVECPIAHTQQNLDSAVNFSTIFNVLRDTAAVFYRRYLLDYYSGKPPAAQTSEIESLKTALVK